VVRIGLDWRPRGGRRYIRRGGELSSLLILFFAILLPHLLACLRRLKEEELLGGVGGEEEVMPWCLHKKLACLLACLLGVAKDWGSSRR
jgi:hypothetical protein